MRIIETKAYQFSELNEEAKQKAIENHYDINVDYDWWEFSSPYDEMESVGIEAQGNKFYFDIDRGSYISFEGRIGLDSLILAMDAIPAEKYKDFASDMHPFLDYCKTEVDKIRPLLKKLILAGTITVYAKIGHGNRSESIWSDCEYYGHDPKNIEEFTDYWMNELESILKMYAEIHLSRLSGSYEYLTSEEAIIESIEANEYEFTEDGKRI